MKIIIISVLFSLCVMSINIHADDGSIFGWLDRSVKLVKDVKNIVIGKPGNKTQNTSNQITTSNSTSKTVNKRKLPKCQVEKPHDETHLNSNILSLIDKEYYENNIAAFEKYENKWFVFTGIVESIYTIPYKEECIMHVYMEDETGKLSSDTKGCFGVFEINLVKSLKKGDKITVMGKIMSDPYGPGGVCFYDCQFERC
jgi:hypothetical protein